MARVVIEDLSRDELSDEDLDKVAGGFRLSRSSRSSIFSRGYSWRGWSWKGLSKPGLPGGGFAMTETETEVLM
jgi:hypothetical protein